MAVAGCRRIDIASAEVWKNTHVSRLSPAKSVLSSGWSASSEGSASPLPSPRTRYPTWQILHLTACLAEGFPKQATHSALRRFFATRSPGRFTDRGKLHAISKTHRLITYENNDPYITPDRQSMSDGYSPIHQTRPSSVRCRQLLTIRRSSQPNDPETECLTAPMDSRTLDQTPRFIGTFRCVVHRFSIRLETRTVWRRSPGRLHEIRRR